MTTAIRLRFIALGLLALAAASGCASDKASSALQPCAGPSASAAGRVVVQPREMLLATGPSLALQCHDEVAHPCGNYSLPRTVAPIDQGLQIVFGSPVAPTICLTSIGSAATSIDLASTPTGSYALDLTASGRHTTGTLLILPDRVELTTCDSNTVAVRGGVLYRLPVNTLFGQLYARTAAAQTAAIALLDSLRREGAQVLTLPTGNYGYFRTDGSGQLIPISNYQNGQPATAIATPVLMTFTGDFNRIKGVVRRRAQYNDLSVGITSARGERAF
ncbi:hypothetical protein [Hymenobacter rubidus]|uniref:hypothetical protein n=1 Tax=Hymenobacter rubidus TaxID=1441626 RepID=UPI00191E1A60|nr:hypothetical protein [Hymenobacter rubidus]